MVGFRFLTTTHQKFITNLESVLYALHKWLEIASHEFGVHEIHLLEKAGEEKIFLKLYCIEVSLDATISNEVFDLLEGICLFFLLLFIRSRLCLFEDEFVEKDK